MINLNTFFYEQLEHWPMALENYRSLEAISVRTLDFGNLTIEIQYNPSRIRSAATDISKQVLASRPCPLCRANHPKEQEAIPFDAHFSISVNPFPIYEPHFTIITNIHTPQRFEKYFMSFLNLAEQFQDYTIFYNGAHCGSSIPDHMHFQALEKDLLPIEKEWHENAKIIEDNSEVRIYRLENYLRSCYVIESDNKTRIEFHFYQLLNRIFGNTTQEEEPMLNLMCRYDGQWRIFLFPRKEHRPRQYYAQGDQQVLTSPGTVDMAGVFVFPREEDYIKADKELIADIYNQISL